MAVAALVLYGIWFALTIGLRTFIQLRRTGDTGFKGLGGRPGSLEWIAGVGFTVALLVGVAGPVAALAGLDPLGVLDAGWIPWAGLVVLVVALELQVRFVEEPYLATVHGEAYERYRQDVGRFVPRWDRA